MHILNQASNAEQNSNKNTTGYISVGSGIQQTQNCGSIGIGYYPNYIYQGYYAYLQQADVEVRKVSNGFIARKAGIDYVFTTPESLASWLALELK